MKEKLYEEEEGDDGDGEERQRRDEMGMSCSNLRR